jgi:hypothetical protein
MPIPTLRGLKSAISACNFLFRMNDQDLPGNVPPGEQGQPLESAEWKEIVRKYQQPSRWASVWQIANTLGPYTALWVLMYFALAVSYWLVVPMAILAGAFLVRTFIIFHDCTHESFFQVAARKRFFGIHYRSAHVHTVSPLAVGAFRASFQRG